MNSQHAAFPFIQNNAFSLLYKFILSHIHLSHLPAPEPLGCQRTVTETQMQEAQILKSPHKCVGSQGSIPLADCIHIHVSQIDGVSLSGVVLETAVSATGSEGVKRKMSLKQHCYHVHGQTASSWTVIHESSTGSIRSCMSEHSPVVLRKPLMKVL